MAVHTFDSLSRAGLLEIGDGYRAKNNELGGNGPIFLRSAYLQAHGFILTDPERFKSMPTERFGPKLSRVGDVVITTKGNSTGRIGRIRPAESGAVYSPHLSYWRSRSDRHIDQSFLYYWAASDDFRRQLAGMAHSTDMAPYLSLRDQLRIQISLPDIARQIEIGAILSALDDKIELNRRMNETLEASARALFQGWLSSHEWRIERGSVAELQRAGILAIGDGYRAKNAELGGPGLPFIRAGELKAGFDTQKADLLNFDSVIKAAEKRSRVGDVAFTSKGTVGRFARVTRHTPEFVYSPQVCFWRSTSHEKLRPSILYIWMTSEDLKKQIDSVSGNTDMAPYVSLADQKKMTLPIFGQAQHLIADQLDALFNQQALNDQNSQSLAVTRDALLPKLMSGEIRVRDAEALAA